MDAEETTSSIVEDSPVLPRLGPDTAGTPGLTAALQEQDVQVTALLCSRT